MLSPALRVLNVRNNEIREVKDSLMLEEYFEQTHKVLDIRDNYIVRVPPLFGCLQRNYKLNLLGFAYTIPDKVCI
jgi:hypothetical protein